MSRLANFSGGPIGKPSERKTGRIKKSELAIPERDPLRDPAYLKSFADRLCWICGGPALPCHLSQGHEGGKSTKADDNLCIPLCQTHHDEMDGRGGTEGNQALYILENLIKPMARRMHTEWMRDRTIMWRVGFQCAQFIKGLME